MTLWPEKKFSKFVLNYSFSPKYPRYDLQPLLTDPRLLIFIELHI